ncbi:hypothetical protein K3552_13065 [Leisingera aquaemixtae]|uniref:hypothetical protein n=1 Tax=Leisingera aquaemixtae TaxID=1396826 RepID=UPI0021A7C0AD|nr:hypothetical protein [Leisingera aquaemixtae]UWQ36433.1 hypothetical protein K3552_13065 [Leisingera aquaemixtae]
MHSVSAPALAPSGLSNALNAVTGSKQPGPPDHAKAWGWRAKQADAAEAAQPPAGTTSGTAETGGAAPADGPDSAAEAAAAPAPQTPSEADMESVILALISGFSETSGANTAPLYDQVKALFA